MDPKPPSRLEAIRARSRKWALENPISKQPGWAAPYARLQALFPLATWGNGRFSVTPDGITEAATQAQIPFNFVLILNRWRATPAGKGTKQFAEFTKLELFDMVFEEYPPTPGPLWFVPADSWKPVLTTGEALRGYIESCPSTVLDDTLFIWSESPRVSLIHHEGGYTHIHPADPAICIAAMEIGSQPNTESCAPPTP